MILATGSMGDRSYTANWNPLGPWSGVGTAEEPFTISSTNDLNALAALVNGGHDFADTYFLQTTNLIYDGTANNYTPIGNYNRRFSGIYDGGGHTVSGINIERTGNSDADTYLGLFGRVYNGIVQNVILADSVIIGYASVGGIVGLLTAGNTVSNCRVGSDVTIKAGCDDAWNHGGIAGYCSDGTIAGCFSAAAVTTNGYGGCRYAGGIVGYFGYGTVRDCLYAGTVVEADNYKGAIAGGGGDTSLVNNLYTGSDVPGGVNGSDANGARRSYAATLGAGVGVSGSETVYDVSGLTAIDGNALALRSLGEGGATNLYSSAGQPFTLTGGNMGYVVTKTADGTDVSADVLNGSTLTMPDYDVTVFGPTWKRLQAAIDAANGATIVLDRDYTATSSDWTLTVTNAVTLDLNGHMLDADNRFRVIEIRSGGHLTLTNSVPESGAITHGDADNGGGVYVHAGGAFTMNGGAISENLANKDTGFTSCGGGVYVEGGGAFTMNSGEISHNNVGANSGSTSSYCYGGGVYVEGDGAFTMNGGTISSNWVKCSGGGVYVTNCTFTITGGEIAGNFANDNGGGVYVADYGTFTMTGGAISDNTAQMSGGGVYVDSGAFTMTGGAISDNTAQMSGGGVCVDGGTFTMDGGAISGNKANCNTTLTGGGGVHVSGGTFTMNGGAISGNTSGRAASAYGGGVSVRDAGTFTMTGGTISGNITATTGAGTWCEGGGVYVNKGTFTMSGGEISCNTSQKNGGGVSVHTIFSSFEMSGGTISGNIALLYDPINRNVYGGGGVYVKGCTFTMTGGTISGNTTQRDVNAQDATGGGVYADGTFNVSGNPVVSGNTNDVGVADNVYLPSGKKIAVDNLTAGAFLGVTTETAPMEGKPVTITTGAAVGDDQYFFSDNPNYSVGTADGQVCLIYNIVFPAYLDGADDTIKTNWVDWAIKYKAGTNAEYEAAFLLNLSPYTAIPAGAAMLKVVDFQVTENGYRFELASDVCDLYHPDGDKSLLCNGYAAVKIAANLSEFSRNAGSSQNAKGAPRS